VTESWIDGSIYGGPQALIDAAVTGKPFADFGYEEQAQIFADYYQLLGGGDTTAYEPYMQSVRNGTWRKTPTAASTPLTGVPRAMTRRE
jgi:hypothetical protein